jgi:hypothetical protein
MIHITRSVLGGLVVCFAAACSQQQSPQKPIEPTEAKAAPLDPAAAPMLANHILKQHGETANELMLQALRIDAATIADRHSRGVSATYHLQDMQSCRDGLIAVSAALNVMAVGGAHNLLVKHDIGEFGKRPRVAEQEGDDFEALQIQQSRLLVACANVLPKAGYDPVFDIKNTTGRELRDASAAALEEMSFFLQAHGETMTANPGKYQLSDAGFCRPLHAFAAVLRPIMTGGTPVNEQNRDRFSNFYSGVKDLCPQYGPIY